MKIGYIGMGKLGWPCALSAASKGHDVVGFDVSPQAYEIMRSRKYPHREVGAQELLDKTTLRMVYTVREVVEHADIVFCAVQTPHKPEFEGLVPMPEHREDFDYAALKIAVGNVAREAALQEKRVTIVVISTCLPGTCDREVLPLLNEWTGFVYSPYFIAMGTTISDFENPEFQLLGCNNPCSEDLALVQRFYSTIHGKPQCVMSVASAEGCKVAYNVFLSLKIVAANSWMEICHKVPNMNIDDITSALALATDRVVSPKYMRGGMGDGGACHPRDIIALAWLAQKLDLSYDVFGMMAHARDRQTEWLADLADAESREGKLPIVVLGKAYKKGTNLTLGSCAILLKNLLDKRPHLEVAQWDPHVDGSKGPKAWFPSPSEPRIYVIAADHDEFFAPDFDIPAGSVVIDPWGKFADREGIKVIRVGRR